MYRSKADNTHDGTKKRKKGTSGEGAQGDACVPLFCRYRFLKSRTFHPQAQRRRIHTVLRRDIRQAEKVEEVFFGVKGGW
jgi:hypothetical protein